MDSLAHSAHPDRGISCQLYADHVCGVMELASKNAGEAAKYWTGDTHALVASVRLAAEFHDLGKLEPANQAVLRSDFRREALPVNHVDAGVAHLLDARHRNLLAAALIYAHHIGLPDFPDQSLNAPGRVLRDTKPDLSGETVKSITDQNLDDYLKIHQQAVSSRICGQGGLSSSVPSPLPPLLFRIALSCLVDADHYDSARHNGNVFLRQPPPLRPEARLRALNEYIRNLDKETHDERDLLRSEIYNACKNADPNPGLYSCDSPVGTGKTTAVMAHLLRTAEARGLRRVFVVLPFTNIIDQSVEVYRRSLVGASEPEEDVVAAHHHRAEFDDLESRHLSFLWKAPIVVVTAVQFFETLASNRPRSLRKLHHLPGSAIFIDEAHAALPTYLWPQAWTWLRNLESEWGCHLVLGSGSLNRFWELEEFSKEQIRLPDLVRPDVRIRATGYEERRIRYLTKSASLSMKDLIEWLSQIPGPRLLIVNTVQSAAVLADEIARIGGRSSIEHLSTALCPRDRNATLTRVKKRLADPQDNDWTLAATSCVEAGLNLSFRNGLRERCSINSLIQIGGRVNREGEWSDSTVWDFELRHDGLLKAHPAFEPSARILGELFRDGLVSAEASTEAMRREVRQEGLRDISDTILKAEKNLQFPIVADKFTVIDSDTVTVVVDREMIRKLEKRDEVDPEMLQRLSVQIWRYKEVEYGVGFIPGFRDLRYWSLLYDDFLGYMAGVLQKLKHEQHGSVV